MGKLECSRIILLVALTALCIDYAGAQVGASGRMTGVVMDSQKAVIPGSGILAKNELTEQTLLRRPTVPEPGPSSSAPGNTPSR